MTRVPEYNRHRSADRDRVYVEFDGRRHYLGRWGTTESRQRYYEMIADHLGDGVRNDSANPAEVTVAAVCEPGWEAHDLAEEAAPYIGDEPTLGGRFEVGSLADHEGSFNGRHPHEGGSMESCTGLTDRSFDSG